MKCRECVFMNDSGGGLYRCANPNSENYMIYTGLCCEDECDDGDYLVPQELEDER